MKILVVTQYYYPEQFRINEICKELQKKGHDVTVLTGLPNYPSGVIPKEYKGGRKRKEFIDDVKVIRVPLVGRKSGFLWLIFNYISYAFFASIKVLTLKSEYDVVFTYQLSPVFLTLPAILYRHKSKKKMLLYCLDLWPESMVAVTRIKKYSIAYKALLKMCQWIYSKCDMIAVSSFSFLSYLEDTIGFQGKKVYLPQFAEELFEDTYQKEGIFDPNTINLLFAGNIGEMQSIETLINAANLLKNKENIKWHFVGDGSARFSAEKLTEYYGLLNKTIFFYGQKPLSEMPQYYSNATALLVSLKADSFVSLTLPGKVQSYLAFGKPIIGAVNGEANNVISQSGAGLCCEAENSIELARIVLEFIENKAAWPLYCKSARDFYNMKYSKVSFFALLERMLKELYQNV